MLCFSRRAWALALALGAIALGGEKAIALSHVYRQPVTCFRRAQVVGVCEFSGILSMRRDGARVSAPDGTLAIVSGGLTWPDGTEFRFGLSVNERLWLTYIPGVGDYLEGVVYRKSDNMEGRILFGDRQICLLFPDAPEDLICFFSPTSPVE
jgi:hypothetical protein